MSAYKSQKEGIKATKDEIKLSLRKLDVEIALYNEQLDLLEEVEFALTNPDDITTISNLVAETLGENALVEATQSAIEQTKNTIKTKINEGITNQQFLLKAINTSLKELNEDLNYTRLEINNINKAINPVKEFLGKMQELVYESSAKKAYENEVISIIREVLSHPDNFCTISKTKRYRFIK
jgi:chromosome segregation ATPase